MVTRRNFFTLATILVIVVGLGFTLASLNQGTPLPNDSDGNSYGYPVNATLLHEYEKNLQSGGPPPDGIPPIEMPNYWAVDEANEYLNDADIIFGLVLDDSTYAYPQRILVWHEIVNEQFNGSRISITYCPLTGSAVGFSGHLPGNDTDFGTTGRLINSNLVMYDRSTNSYFPQILSQAINKNYLGYRLERVYLIWTQWAKWRETYPNTLVLSTDTGFVRDYTNDPYGSYEDVNSYYHNEDILFPLMNEDGRLFEKDVVIGIETLQGQYALQKQYLRTNHVANFAIGNETFVAFYDTNLDTVRTFSRAFKDDILDFAYEDGVFVDDVSGYEWSVTGESFAGNLEEIPNMDVMWFAWAAYFPNSGLLCSNCT